MTYINPDIKSSYQYNDLGRTLYDLVIKEKPEVVVDFGVLDGYSTIAMAMACRDNGKGKVKAYDLFEKYEYTHSELPRLVRHLKEYKLLEYVDIEEANFFDWVKNPGPFDLLHVDISNTGDIVDLMWEKLKDKGTVLFEGGSEERDRVGWVLKHNKKPICQSVAKYEIINSKFPSISRLCNSNI